MVECQLPKLNVVGSIPISRSIFNPLSISTYGDLPPRTYPAPLPPIIAHNGCFWRSDCQQLSATPIAAPARLRRSPYADKSGEYMLSPMP